MIAVDTNILVYAHREDSEFHEPARDLVDGLRRQPASWAIAWPCIHEFIAIATHPAIYKPPSTAVQAFAAIDSWLAGGNVHLLAEGPEYLERLREVVTNARVKGPRVHDARVAALCLEHGVNELWSADRDFSSFPRLKVRNPLIS